MEKNQRLDLQQLPPGFRFHPSDEELIVHYLRKKVTKSPLPASIVADVELYKYNPWNLPKKSTTYGDEEWYFFTPRERKYPNGTRPNRMAASGYWKAVGIDKPILSYCGSKVIGVKKALVFYIGRPPKGSKTDWMMQEYRIPELEVPWSNHREKSMTLDDWVLCRVSQKICMPGSICEERNGPAPSREPLQFLPKMDNDYVHVEDEETTKKQSHLVNSSAIHDTIPVPADNPEMITDYFRKECPMFPLVLLVNNPPQENNYPSMDSVNSCLSYETTTTNNNNNNKSTQSSVSEEKFNLNYLRTRAANMVKRKLPLESGHDDDDDDDDDDDEEMDFKNPNKKAAMNNNNVNPNNVNGMASYSNTTTQMENNNYNGEQMGPTMYHDLYRLAFS